MANQSQGGAAGQAGCEQPERPTDTDYETTVTVFDGDGRILTYPRHDALHRQRMKMQHVMAQMYASLSHCAFDYVPSETNQVSVSQQQHK